MSDISDDEQKHKTNKSVIVSDKWVYTIDDWARENEYALLLLFEEMQHKMTCVGGNVMTGCTFPDFIWLVKQITWVPEMGARLK